MAVLGGGRRTTGRTDRVGSRLTAFEGAARSGALDRLRPARHDPARGRVLIHASTSSDRNATVPRLPFPIFTGRGKSFARHFFSTVDRDQPVMRCTSGYRSNRNMEPGGSAPGVGGVGESVRKYGHGPAHFLQDGRQVAPFLPRFGQRRFHPAVHPV